MERAPQQGRLVNLTFKKGSSWGQKATWRRKTGAPTGARTPSYGLGNHRFIQLNYGSAEEGSPKAHSLEWGTCSEISRRFPANEGLPNRCVPEVTLPPETAVRRVLPVSEQLCASGTRSPCRKKAFRSKSGTAHWCPDLNPVAFLCIGE